MRSKEVAVDVFSRAASSYNSIGPRHFTSFARQLVEYVDVRSSDHILDVATGTGVVLLAAAERCGDAGRMVGVDLTPAMLERAATAIRDRHLGNAELLELDAEHLALPDGTFDVALSAFAISSFPSRGRALEECRRVLRCGGRLGLLDGLGWYFQHDPRWHWHEDVLRSFGVLNFGSSGDSEPSALQAALVNAGFTAVEPTEATFGLVFQDEVNPNTLS